MIEATSCGGVVIFRGKILLLYKNVKHKYEGWVLPKGTVEQGESFPETALREVKEEASAEDISMFVFAPITPALFVTICCATSNTAIVMSKVWVTI